MAAHQHHKDDHEHKRDDSSYSIMSEDQLSSVQMMSTSQQQKTPLSCPLLPQMDATLFLWTASGDGIGTQSLPLWSAFTGQDEQTSAEWGWLRALHPADRENQRRLWEHAIFEKRLYETHYRILARDGKYHVFRMRCTPIFSRQGYIKEWASWLTDITTSEVEFTPRELNSWRNYQLSTLMFEQASTGMLCIALDGHLLQVNTSFCQLSGYSRDELLDEMNLLFDSSDDHNINYTFLRRILLDQSQPHVFERLYRRKDGTMIWCRVNILLLRLPSGEPMVFLVMIEDITLRKRAEKESVQARKQAIDLLNQLQSVLTAMSDSVIVFELGGRIKQLNPAALKMFEIRAETDFLGVYYDEFIKTYHMHETSGELFSLELAMKKYIARLREAKHTIDEDVSIRLPSGNELQLSISCTPVYDQLHHLVGKVCVFRDVTAQRQKERHIQKNLDSLLALVDALERLSDVVDVSSSDGTFFSSPEVTVVAQYLVDLIIQILDCKAAYLYAIEPPHDSLRFIAASGFTDDEEQRRRDIAGQYSLSDYFDAESVARLHMNKVLVIASDHVHFPPTLSDYEAQTMLVVPLFVKDQLVGGFCVNRPGLNNAYTQEEISLVKAVGKLIVIVIGRVRLLNKWAITRANEIMLQEINNRFNDFLGLASHELKTPLTTIMGNIQLALRRFQTLRCQLPEQGEPWHDQLGRVQRPLEYASERALLQDRMINDLLDASRIQANRLDLRIQICNLVDIVSEVVANQQLQNPHRTIVVTIAPGIASIHVSGDPDRLGQVVNNFLTNALKYSMETRPVAIHLSVEGLNARVEVRDEGPGIPLADQPHIWERFYRVKGIEVQSGTDLSLGLGLHLCRMIIELHHGQIGLQSAPGQGSTFWFTLLLAD